MNTKRSRRELESSSSSSDDEPEMCSSCGSLNLSLRRCDSCGTCECNACSWPSPFSSCSACTCGFCVHCQVWGNELCPSCDLQELVRDLIRKKDAEMEAAEKCHITDNLRHFWETLHPMLHWRDVDSLMKTCRTLRDEVKKTLRLVRLQIKHFSSRQETIYTDVRAIPIGGRNVKFHIDPILYEQRRTAFFNFQCKSEEGCCPLFHYNHYYFCVDEKVCWRHQLQIHEYSIHEHHIGWDRPRGYTDSRIGLIGKVRGVHTQGGVEISLIEDKWTIWIDRISETGPCMTTPIITTYINCVEFTLSKETEI